MTKALISFFCFLLLAPLGAKAVSSMDELGAAATRAQEFLCDRSFCLPQRPPLSLKKTGDYLGFFDNDGQSVTVSPELDSGQTQVVLVHEFTHAYRFLFNPHEERWLNEGLAKLMEQQYAYIWPYGYTQRLHNHPVIVLSNDPRNYRPEGDGYPSSFWLMAYLYRHFGGDLLVQKMLRSPRSGWDNIVGAVTELIQENHLLLPLSMANRDAILRQFAVAMWLNDEYAGKFGLFFLDEQYEPLSQGTLGDATSTKPLSSSTNGVQIFYTKNKTTQQFGDVFSLYQQSPIVIHRSESDDQPAVFIHIQGLAPDAIRLSNEN